MIEATASILFDGVAYAMVLFIISVGLSVTMGLMKVVNLAHGAFAMAGGYVLVTATTVVGVPFFAGLAAAFAVVAAASVVLERLVYARLYEAPELDQVTACIGLIMMATAGAILLYGPTPQTVALPAGLTGRLDIGFRQVPTYRATIIVFGIALFLALWFGIERTRLGARIRAAVDNRHMATSLGLDVGGLFTLVFAIGSGLSALGGGLAIEIVGLGPNFATQYLVLFLIVVAVGGLGSVRGTFVAALLLGVCDTAGKYLFPQGGSFFIYVLTVALLMWRPAGLLGRAR